LANPSPLLYRDIQASGLKAYIESQLSDPALSVEAIAQACGERCADALRDDKQALPIHCRDLPAMRISQHGVPPRTYRAS
jgi:hypothetical protein